ncbi:phosphate propanoyltransferase [Sedimentibacter sp. zth1]|uniref:phosphate propanoyltransferase n=1 Tax=Sedimentibacter sp. zth1 TaxID=2816908 RepID=UPI001A938946|nr:phosphate propanoyltransferase [Sedimentibacter sp. zth1]QSX05626.1 phosphate propanoyltransferase [Sedimentibacter sp. zth1]
MSNYEDVMKLLLEMVGETKKDNLSLVVPIGISNRHIHLSKQDMEILFGKGYELNRLKDLSQPGQYACKETVTICGPKGAIEKVRILGPERDKTQVEILAGDCFKLGIKPYVRQSGHLDDTASITIIGPNGSVCINEGVIVAQRHIHMNAKDAKMFSYKDGQTVTIKVSGIRGGTFDNVIVRVSENYYTECHIDTEEANALGVNSSTKIEVIK